MIREIQYRYPEKLYYKTMIKNDDVIMQLSMLRQTYLSAVTRGDNQLAIHSLYNMIGVLPEKHKPDPICFEEGHMEISAKGGIHFTKGIGEREYVRKLSQVVEESIAEYNMEKTNISEYKWKQSTYGQEPKKPIKYCAYGHEIVVSRCKYKHKEVGTYIEEKPPKHWLIEKYKRFFFLDYKERLAYGQ